jgi:glycosyltransferase involved in cell wall biosynthesis
MLRIAQVVRPAAGGIRSHVRALVGGLDPAQFSCTVYGPSALDLDARVAPHGLIDIRAGMNPAADMRAILKLAVRLRGTADLLHAHGLRGAAIGVPAARLAGIPAIFTAHNLVPVSGRLQRGLVREVVRRAGGIIAVSEAVAATLVAVGIARDRVTVIPNGIDMTAFEVSYDRGTVRAGYGVPPEVPLIVAVGRLAPEKGLDTLLGAFPIILARLPDAHLIVAGDGPERERLRALAAENTERIHLIGQVIAVAPLLAAADVVAIPSRSEGQGIVALEAMAAGRAIVASRVGGLIETVRDGQTGLLVPPDATTPLADALSSLLIDCKLGVRFGNAGRARVVQEYTLDRMLHRIAMLYHWGYAGTGAE